MTSLIVRDDLIITADGVKLFKVQDCNLLIFDKDKRRCKERGCNYVEIQVDDLLDVLQSYCEFQYDKEKKE